MKYLLAIFTAALLFSACKKETPPPPPPGPGKTEVCKLNKVTYKSDGQKSYDYTLNYDGDKIKGVDIHDSMGAKVAWSEISYIGGGWMSEELVMTPGVPQRKHVYKYDDQGRMITRLLYINTGSGLQLWEKIAFKYSYSKLPDEMINYWQTVCTYESEFIEKNRITFYHNDEATNITGLRQFDASGNPGDYYTFEFDNKPSRRSGFALQYWSYLDDYIVPTLLSKNNVTKVTIKSQSGEESTSWTTDYTYTDKGLVKTELRNHGATGTQEFIFEDVCVVE